MDCDQYLNVFIKALQTYLKWSDPWLHEYDAIEPETNVQQVRPKR